MASRRPLILPQSCTHLRQNLAIFVLLIRDFTSLSIKSSVSGRIGRMGQFGGYYKGDKRKLKKSLLEKKAQKQIGAFSPWQLPKVEIIKKGKKEW